VSDTFNPAKLQEAVFVAYENTVVTDYNTQTGRCYLNGYWHEVHAPTETDPFGRPICYQV